jgi:hypothetical protein
MEYWMHIPDYEGLYKASSKGRIIKLNQKYPDNWNFLKLTKTPLDYRKVNLIKNGRYKLFLVHRLIALTFIPNPENKPFINHKNGIKKDNRIENLEWCTHLENVRHAIQIGLFKSIRQRLTKNKVIEIRFAASKNWSTIEELSKKYDVSISTIINCINFKTHNNV